MFIEKIDGRVMCENCKNYAITYIQHLHNLNADDPEWFFEPFDGSENGLYQCTTCNYNDYISDSEVMSYLFDGIKPDEFEKVNQESKYHLIDLERSIGHGIITYWNQSCHGYTDKIENAGIFSKLQAKSIVVGDIDELTVMIPTRKIVDILKL